MVAAVLLAAPWPGRVPELIGCGRAREHFLDIRAVNEFSLKFVRKFVRNLEKVTITC